jgi:hypothetical protein
MICLIALPVLAILAIFSATHRKLFYEAVDCVFRKVTLRKCQSRLDERLKARITGKLINRSPKIASFVYHKFEVFSWILVIITLVTLFFSAQGAYNYVVHGNCNGPDSDDFCIYNIFEESHVVCENEDCKKECDICGEECTCDVKTCENV